MHIADNMPAHACLAQWWCCKQSITVQVSWIDTNFMNDYDAPQ